MNLLSVNEVVRFKDNELEIDVNISSEQDTVWLTVEQISKLFEKNKSTITRHINNIFIEEELDKNSSVAKNATQLERYDPRTGKNRIANVEVNYYNLDVIISIGYRVKSKRGIIFRKWANNIIKDYLLKGYAINEKHYQETSYIIRVLEEYKMKGGELPNSDTLLEFLKSYQRGFDILDEYDHHSLTYPEGGKDIYIIEYQECMDLIQRTVFANKGDLFSIEKDNSFKSSIATIYQSFGGKELYPTLEDKASALLYFIVKNHSFADGNKRIGATVFLYFLEKNSALHKNGKLRISEETLAILTILIAVSNPEDKEMITRLVRTVLN